jgi:hypothetical protein
MNPVEQLGKDFLAMLYVALTGIVLLGLWGWAYVEPTQDRLNWVMDCMADQQPYDVQDDELVYADCAAQYATQRPLTYVK